MYRRTSNFILETRKIYVYSSFTRKLVTGTIRLHGSRPTFSLISPVTRFLASIWKQCPSIKCTPTFPIRARKGSAVARSIVVNTRMIVSVTRNFPLCVIRTCQSSESGGVIFFFFTRGRCNVTFVTCYATYEITFDTGTFLAWPVAAALLLSLQDQQRKLKLSTCPLTRGHFR